MTNAMVIVDMLVKNGMAVNEAVEAVGYDNGLTLSAEEQAVKNYEEKVSKYGKVLADYVFYYDEIKAMSDEERDVLYARLNKVLNANGYIDGKNYINGKDVWKVVYRTYCTYEGIIDEEYYERNIEAFREFESHMGEPDFDWGTYSDWHKDMFGFRPR